MKIGIYSDVHFSLTSSILNKSKNYKYSQRLDTIIESYKWMYDQFKDCNLIINCGDTTDSDVLLPEVNSALYEAYSLSDKKEIHILGNHEIKDSNHKYSSVSILNGFKNNIEIVNNTKVYDIDENKSILFVSYRQSNNYDDIYEYLRNNSSKKYYLITHSSYIGEDYNNFVVKDGIDVGIIKHLGNVLNIFNGHIHAAKDHGIYHQVGILCGLNFSDNYYGGYPGVIILDTDTNKFERIVNPYSPLFIKINTNDIKDVKLVLENTPDNTKCLRINCKADKKFDIENYIEGIKDNCNIIEYKIKALSSEQSLINENVVNSVKESLVSFKTPYEALLEFTKIQDKTPYDQKDMIEFLSEYIER